MGSLAAVVSSMAYVAYVVEIAGGSSWSNPFVGWVWRTFGLKGGVRPRLMSWIIWMFLSAAMVAVNVRDDESRFMAILCAGYFLGNLALLTASFRCGTWKVVWYDYLCLALGMAAIGLLFCADSARSATFLILVADIIAGFSTFIGVVDHPSGESRAAWRFFLVGACVNMLALEHPFAPCTWTFVASAYTIYVVCCTTYMVTMTTFRRQSRPSPS
jgi:hypothetical protein